MLNGRDSFFPPQGLAALAAFNTARGDERSVEEAVDLWTEACSTSPDEEDERDGSDSGDERGAVGGEGDGASSAGTSGNDAFRLARASVLCSSAQGEMILRRGTATASERLGEALKIREELLPSGHPATVRRGGGLPEGSLPPQALGSLRSFFRLVNLELIVRPSLQL